MDFLRKYKEKEAQAQAAAAAAATQQTRTNIQNAQLVQKPLNTIRAIGSFIAYTNKTMKNVNQQTKGMSKTEQNQLFYTHLRNTAKKAKEEKIQTLQKLKNQYNQKLQTFKQGNQSNTLIQRKIRVFSNIKNAIDKELVKAALLNANTNTLEELNTTSAVGAGAGATMGGKQSKHKSRKASRRLRRRSLTRRRR